MAKLRKHGKHEVDSAQPQKAVRYCVIDRNCLEDLQWCVTKNLKIALRTLDLMEQVLREPFAGLGKPEPLKGLGANTWSRRLTEEHRLVYVVFDDRVTFLMARYHY